jgi:fructosamine-3-kinase
MSRDPAIHQTLETHVSGIVGDTVVRSRTLTGGLMGEVVRMEFARRDPVVVKSSPVDGHLTIEARMLRHLASTGAIPVPDVLHAVDDLLVLELIEGVHLQPAAEPHCGALLATLHTVTEDAFGFGGQTLNGRVVLESPWTDSWVDFYARHRLRFSLELADRHAPLPADMRAAVEAVLARIDSLLREPPRPALLHGDLWAANVLSVANRVTAFLDPSACYGDPEIELAYVDAWQSFGMGFWEAYTAIHRIDDEFFRVRRHVYALYPLLMHVYYFGERFLPKLAETLARIRRHM